MIKVIGVRFRQAGKIYFFSPGKFDINKGDNVIVETARGVEYGRVVQGIHEVDENNVIQPLKSVIRVATEEDQKFEEANREKENKDIKLEVQNGETIVKVTTTYALPVKVNLIKID